MPKGYTRLLDDLYEMSPEWLQVLYDGLEEKYLDLSDDKLLSNCPVRHSNKYAILRERFWLEYNNSRSSGTKMSLPRVVSGVIGSATFGKLCKNPFFLSYISSPPEDYEVTLLSLLRNYGLSRYEEILRAPLMQPHSGKSGEIYDKFDTNLAKLQVQVLGQLEDRIYGKSVDRRQIQQHNTQVNGNGSKQLGEVGSINSVAAIESELRAIGGKNVIDDED